MFSRSSRALLVGAVLVAALAVATAQEKDSNHYYGPGGPGSKHSGATGPTGPRGSVGPTGPQGAQGVKGDDGPAGPAGARGPQGPQGNDGAAGGPGPAGTPGAAGAQGPQGDAGAVGAPGLNGLPGPAGPQGDAGTNGAAGTPGAEGPQGFQGVPGAGSSSVFNTANSPRVDQSLAAGSNQDFTVDCVQPDPALNPTGPARAIDAGWTVSNAPDPAQTNDAVVCSSTSSGSTCQYRCYNGAAAQAYGVSFFCTCGFNTAGAGGRRVRA